VNGQTRTIDVHAHCVFPDVMALMGLNGGAYAKSSGIKATDDEIARRLSAMDAQGIDMQVLSVNPVWYGLEPDLARAVIEKQNDHLAEMVARHPDRLAAFATVALQHPQLAAEELTYAVKTLGLRGAAIGASANGVELSDPRFDPFWAKVEELGAVIFIHPQGMPELDGRLGGSGNLKNVIGYPLETTIALSHLIFEGTLDRYPGLKILAAHGGGFLPSYMNRSDHGIRTFPATYTTPLKKRPTAYLKENLYYDTLVFTPEALRHLAAEIGADRLMLGTDFPFGWVDRGVEHILETPDLSDDERCSMLGDLAERVLGLPRHGEPASSTAAPPAIR
jgi:aminocarboxymuconate-semialdehyde decarboxylase